MNNFDASNAPVVICLELTRIGHRQTVHLKLASESIFKDFRLSFVQNSENVGTIQLANGDIFTVDMSSVWYMYRLPNSYVYSSDTLILG